MDPRSDMTLIMDGRNRAPNSHGTARSAKSVITKLRLEGAVPQREGARVQKVLVELGDGAVVEEPCRGFRSARRRLGWGKIRLRGLGVAQGHAAQRDLVGAFSRRPGYVGQNRTRRWAEGLRRSC